MLLAAETALTAATPIPDDELLAVELTRLDRNSRPTERSSFAWRTYTSPGCSGLQKSNAVPATSTCATNHPPSGAMDSSPSATNS
jgi:hypothetical protein